MPWEGLRKSALWQLELLSPKSKDQDADIKLPSLFPTFYYCSSLQIARTSSISQASPTTFTDIPFFIQLLSSLNRCRAMRGYACRDSKWSGFLRPPPSVRDFHTRMRSIAVHERKKRRGYAADCELVSLFDVTGWPRLPQMEGYQKFRFPCSGGEGKEW